MPTFTPEDNIHSIKTVKRSNGISKLFTNFLIVLTTVSFCLGGYFVYTAATTSSSIFDAESSEEECNNWICGAKQSLSKITQVLSPEAAIKGQDRGRTNFLILGLDATPGGGLTDTIMIASYYHKEKKAVTVNIPRDFLVQYKTLDPYSNQLVDSSVKINEVFRSATQRGLNGGREISNFVSKEFNLPIDYWITANFDAVEKTVEAIGGIDVNVDNSFTDCEYPNRNYTGLLPCQTFDKGVEKMTAVRALIYARSRHGDNNEGSDFARARRQSIVIQSIVQKIKGQNLLASITSLNSLFGILGNNVKTSMTVNELKSVVSILRGVDLKSNYSKVIWAVGNGFLCDQTTQDFGYHIFYCDGAVGGSNSIISTGRNKARLDVQNLLMIGNIDRLSKISFDIYGNDSSSARKLSTSLTKLGFESINLNNNKTIIPITPGKDVVNVYIKDLSIYNEVKQLDLDSKLNKNSELNLINSEPLGLDVDDTEVDVVIWAE